MPALKPVEQEVLDEMLARRPELDPCVPALLELHTALVQAYENGGKLLVCGNGGSHADAVHIVGELCKSFERKRPVPASLALRLQDFPQGRDLAQHLESGLPAVTLGLNSALKTAIENDCKLRDIAFAQEAYALGAPGDVLLAISTSGNAMNGLMALTLGRALGMRTVAMTGPDGGHMARLAEIAVRAPGASTKVVQEAHLVLYHTFCAMIEAHFFPEKR